MRIDVLDLKKPWVKQGLGGKRPDKSICFVRYGAFGDLIQASSVFPYFKDNGWDITVNTTPHGYEIIKHDPHVDGVFLQETGQVRNPDLKDYWDKMADNFDKFVNFSESVEGSLLAISGQPGFDMDSRERHNKMNVDYYHRMHDIAGANLPPRPAFYPSAKEARWAKEQRKKMGAGNFVILWALSGSAVHKMYPHMDSVIAGLMLNHPVVRIVFCGDGFCRILEEAWRKEKKIYRKSDRWSIRETLAFAKHADLVIGPETGVLNAVSHEPMPKVIFLSHSSPINIGGNWPNTTTLVPHGVDCYPCHQMHYGWETCKKAENYNEVGGAACAAGISPDRVYRAIESYITEGQYTEAA